MRGCGQAGWLPTRRPGEGSGAPAGAGERSGDRTGWQQGLTGVQQERVKPEGRGCPGHSCPEVPKAGCIAAAGHVLPLVALKGRLGWLAFSCQ